MFSLNESSRQFVRLKMNVITSSGLSRICVFPATIILPSWLIVRAFEALLVLNIRKSPAVPISIVDKV